MARSTPRKRNFGSIRQLPSGRQQARFTAPDGTMVKAPSTFATYKEADAWLAVQYAELMRGTWQDPNAGNVTVGAYATTWLDARRASLAPRTVTLYEQIIDRWVLHAPPSGSSPAASPAYRLGDRPLRQVSRPVVAQWFETVLAASREGALKRLTPAAGGRRHSAALRGWAREQDMEVTATGKLPTFVRAAWEAAGRPPLNAAESATENAGHAQASQAYRVIKSIFESAVRDGLIPANPCQITGAGQSRAAERVPATLSELEGIYEAMPARYRAAVLIAAWGGLRAGEVFALARRHINPAAGAIKVERSLTYLPGHGFSFGPPKTRAGLRTVHLPAEVMALIAEHLGAHTGADDDALVFSTSTGAPLHPSNRTVVFRRAAARAGRDDLRFHDLRHTGATLAARSGATLKDLMRRLGHSSVRAALIYQHAADDTDRQIAERLGELRRAS